jgi:16S rRNA (cytosine1402-N4)-methyltransferase
MAIDPQPSHIPVLCKEMVEILNPSREKVYVDGTFGGGGYTRAILNKGAAKVIAFDRDEDAIKRAEVFKKEFGDRFEIIHSCFSEMDKYLKPQSIDGIVFDFGISSYQVDEAHRGFSFRQNGPLDMRMGLGAKYTAAEVVNTFKERDIAEILYVYGEEPKSRQIAKAIITARAIKPFETTQELALLIRKIVPSQEGFDPATLTFQGLRIFINNELMEIEHALQLSSQLLPIGGRLVTVAFHALEDRLVKIHTRMTNHHGKGGCIYSPINRKAITPSLEEIRLNPRSRSAKLRGFIKKEHCQ